MQPSIFLSLFEQWNLPEGWLAGLIDRNGNFIARSRNHEQNVGQPASEGFRAAARTAAQGWNEMLSLEGGTIANAHVTSPLSGWVMGLAADKALFEAPIRNTILIAALAGGATTLLSLLLAIWSARRIARPIEQIEQGTHALMLRRAITFSNTGLPEADRTLDALASTARVFEQHDKERDEREAHVRLIMRELSHRSKNLLAIVLAIARQTSRHTASFSDFESRFNSRIQALADAHDLLVEQQWSGALYRRSGAARNSPPSAWRRSPAAASGSCCAPRRCRTSRWRCTSSPPTPRNTARCRCRPARSTSNGRGSRRATGERNLRLTWRESGGPPVTPPSQKGFGCFVLERVTVNALGEGGLEFNPDGLVWTCIIRPEHLVDGDERPRRTPKRAAAGGRPHRRRS